MAAIPACLALLTGAPAQDPGAADLTRRGSAHLERGELQPALEAFRGALRARPDDPALEYNVGLALFRMGRFDEARGPLGRALAHPPSALGARFMRGIIRFRTEEFEEAAQDLEFVREHPRLGEQALYMLTECLRKAGREQGARRAFLDLQGRYPGSAFYHKLMGTAYDADGLTEQALAEFRAALRKSPGLPEAAFAIGYMHYKRRDHEQAAAWLRRELEGQPCYARAHFYLGEIALAAGDLSTAGERFRRAASCDGGYADAHAGLGTAYERLGRLEEAAAALRKATDLDPGSARAHYRLSRVLLRLGRQGEAAAAMETVDRIHAASHRSAREALGGEDGPETAEGKGPR